MHGKLQGVMRAAGVSIRYPVVPSPEAWVLPEGTVPESIPHDDAAEHLKLMLLAWALRSERELAVARNLAIRWLEEFPRTGIDPDVCVLEPPPPDFEDLGSVCTWREGHQAPRLCFEIVSASHPHKDYHAIQDRYAAMGTRELVVFDPLLVGPASLGGPAALQLWRRDPVGVFERVHFGNQPVFSEVLDAWVRADGRRLAISDDRAGARRWPTGEEAERRRADDERRRADLGRERADAALARARSEEERAERERVEREALALRVAELEAKLAR
jgi:Uma2 family endonuclease